MKSTFEVLCYHQFLTLLAEGICAVGYGVCALFSGLTGKHKKSWCFKSYSMTAVSLLLLY